MELVPIVDIQHHGVQFEASLNQLGQFMHKVYCILVKHHLLAERVKTLHVFTALLSVKGLAACALGQAANHDGAEGERQHLDPFLNARQTERVQWNQEKIIEGERA